MKGDHLPGGVLIIGGAAFTVVTIQPGVYVAYTIVGVGVVIAGVLHFRKEWRRGKMLEQRDEEKE